jgi:t-SNARE complex subunit (syntaxin)
MIYNKNICTQIVESHKVSINTNLPARSSDKSPSSRASNKNKYIIIIIIIIIINIFHVNIMYYFVLMSP